MTSTMPVTITKRVPETRANSLHIEHQTERSMHVWIPSRGKAPFLALTHSNTMTPFDESGKKTF